MNDFKKTLLEKKKVAFLLSRETLIEYLTEYFFLNENLNLLDFFLWRKKTNSELHKYLDEFFKIERFQSLAKKCPETITVKKEWNDDIDNNTHDFDVNLNTNLNNKVEKYEEDELQTLIEKVKNMKKLNQWSYDLLPKLHENYSGNNVYLKEMKLYHDDLIIEKTWKSSVSSLVSNELLRYYDFAMIPDSPFDEKLFFSYVKISSNVRIFWENIQTLSDQELNQSELKKKPIIGYCYNLYKTYLCHLCDPINKDVVVDVIENMENLLNINDINIQHPDQEDESPVSDFQNIYSFHAFTPEEIIAQLIETNHINYDENVLFSLNPTIADITKAFIDDNIYDDFYNVNHYEPLKYFPGTDEPFPYLTNETTPEVATILTPMMTTYNNKNIDNTGQDQTSSLQPEIPLFFDFDRLETWFKTLDELTRLPDSEFSVETVFDRLLSPPPSPPPPPSSRHLNDPSTGQVFSRYRAQNMPLNLPDRKNLKKSHPAVVVVVLDPPEYRILNHFVSQPYHSSSSEKLPQESFNTENAIGSFNVTAKRRTTASNSSNSLPTTIPTPNNNVPRKINIFSIQTVTPYFAVQHHSAAAVAAAINSAAVGTGNHGYLKKHLSAANSRAGITGGISHSGQIIGGSGNISAPVKSNASISQQHPTIMTNNNNWLIYETWALITCIRQLQGFAMNILITTPAHSPNWDFGSDFVNIISTSYKSAKECRNHYENVLNLATKGAENYFAASPDKENVRQSTTVGHSPSVKRQKTKHSPTKTLENNLNFDIGYHVEKTFNRDDFATYRKFVTEKFDRILRYKPETRNLNHLFPGINPGIRNFGISILPTRFVRPTSGGLGGGGLKEAFLSPRGGKESITPPPLPPTDQLVSDYDLNMALFNNYGINYNVPLDPLTLIRSRLERINREKRNQQQQQLLQNQPNNKNGGFTLTSTNTKNDMSSSPVGNNNNNNTNTLKGGNPMTSSTSSLRYQTQTQQSASPTYTQYLQHLLQQQYLQQQHQTYNSNNNFNNQISASTNQNNSPQLFAAVNYSSIVCSASAKQHQQTSFNSNTYPIIYDTNSSSAFTINSCIGSNIINPNNNTSYLQFQQIDNNNNNNQHYNLIPASGIVYSPHNSANKSISNLPNAITQQSLNMNQTTVPPNCTVMNSNNNNSNYKIISLSDNNNPYSNLLASGTGHNLETTSTSNLLSNHLTNITNLTQLLNTLNQAAAAGLNTNNNLTNTVGIGSSVDLSNNYNNQLNQTLNLLDHKTLLKIFGGGGVNNMASVATITDINSTSSTPSLPIMNQQGGTTTNFAPTQRRSSVANIKNTINNSAFTPINNLPSSLQHLDYNNNHQISSQNVTVMSLTGPPYLSNFNSMAPGEYSSHSLRLAASLPKITNATTTSSSIQKPQPFINPSSLNSAHNQQQLLLQQNQTLLQVLQQHGLVNGLNTPISGAATGNNNNSISNNTIKSFMINNTDAASVIMLPTTNLTTLSTAFSKVASLNLSSTNTTGIGATSFSNFLQINLQQQSMAVTPSQGIIMCQSFPSSLLNPTIPSTSSTLRGHVVRRGQQQLVSTTSYIGHHYTRNVSSQHISSNVNPTSSSKP